MKQHQQRVQSTETLMERLRYDAPELLEQVDAGKLTLVGALAELDERQRLHQVIGERGRSAAEAICGELVSSFALIKGALEAGHEIELKGGVMAETIITIGKQLLKLKEDYKL